MLKQRVITSVLLIAGSLGAIAWLPNSALTLVLLLLILLGGWEWSRLTHLNHLTEQVIYLLILGVCAYVAWVVTIERRDLLLVILGAFWWTMVLVVLAVYRPAFLVSRRLRYGFRVAGVLTLIPAWVAIADLHRGAPKWLIFLLGLIWISDSAAYFTGRRYGKTPLAPAISPNKTREGFWGGMTAAVVSALIGALWLELPMIAWVYFIALSLLTTLYSVVGDLFESLLKRYAAVKDSSNLLPGHGGILDRIDSMTAAAPLFLLGMSWFS